MSIDGPYVAVDWGTTRMRAMLCSGSGDVLDRIDGAGIGEFDRPAPDAFFDAIAPWATEHRNVDVLLAGMVGSNLGWRATPYMECPLRPADVAQNLMGFEDRGHRIRIVPGAMCRNPLGLADVMRGEEVQVLGWMAEDEVFKTGDRLVCLPGTHTKWVQVRDGVIATFTTAFTGELFAHLVRHSVLVDESDRAATSIDDAAFADGVQVATSYGNQLLHMIFSTRSRTLCDPSSVGDARSYLSGLLIGSDVQSALAINRTINPMVDHMGDRSIDRSMDDSLYEPMDDAISNSMDDLDARPVELIGAPQLCARYADAMNSMGASSRIWDGDDMALAGLLTIAESAR